MSEEKRPTSEHESLRRSWTESLLRTPREWFQGSLARTVHLEPPPRTLEELRSREGEAWRVRRMRKLFTYLDVHHRGFIDETSLGQGLERLAARERSQDGRGVAGAIRMGGLLGEKRYARELLLRVKARQPTAGGTAVRGKARAVNASAAEPMTRIRGQGEEVLEPVGDNIEELTMSYEEFENYIVSKETDLWNLFVEIDQENLRRICRQDLSKALEKRGINVDKAVLGRFVDAMDRDQDGMISFDEFRSFLLLLPNDLSIGSIYRYFLPRAQVTMEGDVSVHAPDLPSKRDDQHAHKKVHHDGAASHKADEGQQDVEEDDEEEETDSHQFAAWSYLFAGGVAGAVSRSATAPFDRLKVYLITRTQLGTPEEVLKSARRGSPIGAARLFWNGCKGLLAASNDLYARNGIRGFWTGNGLNLVKIFPESAIKFYSYEHAKRVFARLEGVDDQTKISGTARFCAGGIGGLTSQFAIYPIETLKTRLMSSTGEGSKGNALLKETAKDMWKKGGLRTYYLGLTAGLVGVFPYSAIDMSTYEGLKLAYISYYDEDPNVVIQLTTGALSGSIGAAAVYPLNLARTRLQAQGTPQHKRTYTGLWDVFAVTYQSEGVRGLYKGLAPTILKVGPAVAISYVTYEKSKKLLGVP